MSERPRCPGSAARGRPARAARRARPVQASRRARLRSAEGPSFLGELGRAALERRTRAGKKGMKARPRSRHSSSSPLRTRGRAPRTCPEPTRAGGQLQRVQDLLPSSRSRSRLCSILPSSRIRRERCQPGLDVRAPASRGSGRCGSGRGPASGGLSSIAACSCSGSAAVYQEPSAPLSAPTFVTMNSSSG